MTLFIREFVLAMSSSLPASVIAKATVIAAFGLMGARLARRSRAAVRHLLLAAMFGVLLLLPVSSLIVPPVRIAVPTVRMSSAVPSAPAVGGEWILPFTARESHPAAPSAPSRSSRPPLSSLLFVLWLAGGTLALIPLIAGLWKIRWLRRSGLPWADGQTVVDRLSLQAGFRRRVEVVLHEELPGPIASGILHPTILFPPDAQTWGTEDLDRAAVHEFEHLRRGDVVTHFLARAVCAAYWFHPLVWTAWRQLILEAERSCDDAVIARSEATAYADQLVGLARRLLAVAKSPLLAMANRSDLVIRVGAVLDSRQRRGRVGSFAVALGCAAATVLVLTISPLRTVSAPQSSSAQTVAGSSPASGAGASLPSFEVASIKPSPVGEMGPQFVGGHPGIFAIHAATTKDIVVFAYNVLDFQVSGGPSWVNSERFRIEAKEEDSLGKELQRLPFDQRMSQLRLMVQSLLEDRFKLRLIHRTKELPVYALGIAKGGPKLHESKSGDTYPTGITGPDGRGIPGVGTMDIGGGRLRGQGIPLSSKTGLSLGQMLSWELIRPVLDRTGLTGNYDINLQWTSDQSPVMSNRVEGDKTETATAPPPDSSGPSIFTAIQEQLGLKLESTKGPVDVMVIDHIERPTAN